MAYHYPAPPPTVDGQNIDINRLLRSPQLVARRVKDLAAEKFIGDYLLPGRYNAVGGAILYESGEPLYTDDDPEVISPGGEYPRTTHGEAALQIAATRKVGFAEEVMDESVTRMQLNPVNRALNKAVNRMVRYADGACLGVIASKVSSTTAASAAWAASAANIVETLLLAHASKGEALKEGLNLDTVVLGPVQYAKVMSMFVKDGMLPREQLNPVLSGTYPTQLAGFTWVTSPNVPFTDPFLVDRENLGGIASEQIISPDFATASNGVEVKTDRIKGRDGWEIYLRRVFAAIVIEPLAGTRITGTGL